MKAKLPVLVIAATATWAFSSTAADKASPPTPQEEVLESLEPAVGATLFDPAGCEFVRFDLVSRGVWGGADSVSQTGWRKIEGGKTSVHLSDGFAVPKALRSNLTRVDFIAECEEIYAEKSIDEEEDESDDAFERMRLDSFGLAGNNALADAAWLQSMGHAELARRAAQVAIEYHRGEGTLLALWPSDRAWFYFAGMVHAYMQCEDAEAKNYGEFLFKQYPELAEKRFGQAKQILADLGRRGAAQPHPEFPPEGADVAARIEFWIRALEDVYQLQDGQPGGIDFAAHATVQELIKIGEPAIPRLIETIEKDQRLTRSVHFWRDFAQSRTVLGVHEAALVAAMSILRTSFFEAASTGDNLTARGDEGREHVAAQLRAYWKKFGGQSFEERMMNVLKNEEAGADARREAAQNLSLPEAEQVIGTTVWTDRIVVKNTTTNPNIAHFNSPTVAEAILGSLDWELESDDEGDARWAVRFYTSTLVDLGDRRVAAILARRAEVEGDLERRCLFAVAADDLGVSEATKALRRELIGNRLARPEAEHANREFDVMFRCLESSSAKGDPEVIKALCEPGHHWHAAACAAAAGEDSGGYSWNAIESHPWCLLLLEKELANTERCGPLMKLSKSGDTWFLYKGSGGRSIDPDSPLLDTENYEREWELRRCDRAAMALPERLGDHAGDSFSPLAKNRDELLSRLRKYMEQHRGRFRELSDYLDGGTGFAIEGGLFLPVLPTLATAATQADVEAGRAMFALDNPGNRPVINLPLAANWLKKKPSGAVFSTDPNYVPSREVVVLQIERGHEGGLHFGIADGNGFYIVPSREISVLRAIQDP